MGPSHKYENNPTMVSSRFPPAPDPKRQIGPVTILNVSKSDEIVRFHKFPPVLVAGSPASVTWVQIPRELSQTPSLLLYGTLCHLYIEIDKFSCSEYQHKMQMCNFSIR